MQNTVWMSACGILGVTNKISFIHSFMYILATSGSPSNCWKWNVTFSRSIKATWVSSNMACSSVCREKEWWRKYSVYFRSKRIYTDEKVKWNLNQFYTLKTLYRSWEKIQSMDCADWSLLPARLKSRHFFKERGGLHSQGLNDMINNLQPDWVLVQESTLKFNKIGLLAQGL